jgi:hypothetical protein
VIGAGSKQPGKAAHNSRSFDSDSKLWEMSLLSAAVSEGGKVKVRERVEERRRGGG